MYALCILLLDTELIYKLKYIKKNKGKQEKIPYKGRLENEKTSYKIKFFEFDFV